MNRLSIADYVVFAVMLLISLGIGIYHGFKSKRQQTTATFLMADRSMNRFPIAVSLLVSFLSAVAILGIPSEVYTFGFSYVLTTVGFAGVLLISAYVYVPVFYNLKITSTNEYLEMRFSPGIRLCGSILFIITYTMYLSIALYAPALALEAVSGLPLYVSIIVNGFVSVFYTTLGGLKAVIWTDVFQGLVIGVGLIAVLITGTIEVGGLDKVWEISRKMDRTDIFIFNPDPSIRNTFWTMTIGSMFSYLFSWSVSQISVQRFLASKSLKHAQSALLMNIPVLFVLCVVFCLDGLVIFAVYADCDLVKEGKITRNDQIVPYFVVDKLNYIHGLPGLFIASLFSGCLRERLEASLLASLKLASIKAELTVSSGINSLSAIILEDIVKKVKKDIPDAKATLISKLIGAVYGVIIILGAFSFKFIKAALLIQLTASLLNLCAGPLLGVFTLGMLTKRANWKGAYIGQAVALGLVLWIYAGSLMYPHRQLPLPTSVKGCVAYNVTMNISSKAGNVMKNSHPLTNLYNLSFWYYGLIGVFVTVIVGIIFSYILETSADRSKRVDEKLLLQLRWPKCLSKKPQSGDNTDNIESPVLQKYVRDGTKENIPMTSLVNNGYHEN